MLSHRTRLRFYQALLGAMFTWFAVSSEARGLLWASAQLLCRQGAVVVRLEDTGSMEPTYDTRDILVVQACAPEQIQPGDVISFTLPADLARKYGCTSVFHRVVGYTDGGWATKGDNNEAVDWWVVRPDQVRGKLVARFRT